MLLTISKLFLGIFTTLRMVRNVRIHVEMKKCTMEEIGAGKHQGHGVIAILVNTHFILITFINTRILKLVFFGLTNDWIHFCCTE